MKARCLSFALIFCGLLFGLLAAVGALPLHARREKFR